jgi:hypothetical protein
MKELMVEIIIIFGSSEVEIAVSNSRRRLMMCWLGIVGFSLVTLA